MYHTGAGFRRGRGVDEGAASDASATLSDASDTDDDSRSSEDEWSEDEAPDPGGGRRGFLSYLNPFGGRARR